MIIPGGYLIYLGDADTPLTAKTGFGLVHWRPELCVGQYRGPDTRVSLGIADMTPARARQAGARTMVIGVAPAGGSLSGAWIAAIVEALDAGLNIASGMHTRLGSVDPIAAAAARSGCKLFDVRYADRSFPIATGRKRSGRRLLTVGTDCAVGKKYTALSIAREMRLRGIGATFRATGQTGILIAGQGVAVDAVVADFVAGAAEWLSPDNEAEHWDVIEGQGSLFHPAYAGVSAGLLHGSQPDALVLCHEPGRASLDEYADFRVPRLSDCIDLNLRLAGMTNPAVRCVGISLNCSAMPVTERSKLLGELTARHAIPCFDPVATGVGPLLDRLEALYP